MKPITFENLRRLMGGGRKKKEKESSFKRSDSFKRISIRKSYLDRGKKKHLHKLEVATQTVSEEIETEPSRKDSSVQVDKVDVNQSDIVHSKLNKKGGEGPGQSVIAYGQWLKGIRKEDNTSSSTGVKGFERTVIYIPASDETKIPSTVIRQLSSSPVFRKKSPTRRAKQSPQLQRKESNDSAVEMFPWGDSVDIKKSPLIRRRSRQSPPLLPDSGAEEMCSLSISLGRIWMDAPQVMAPRSLELPRGAQPAVIAHNSLDSALKDLRDDPIVLNRLQKRPTPPVARTLSSNSNTTASTGLFSSKDSGFSFSISAPKLSDFNSSMDPSPSRGFFRRKRPKPKLSVSRDGYFKRTSGVLVESKRTSLRRRSSRKSSRGSSRRKKKSTAKNEMYQVVVNRPPRCLKSLKLDPMIFVPPEKRKNSINKKPSFKINLREIRSFNPADSSLYSDRVNVGEGLYESLPGVYDDLSDEHPLSGRISRISLRDEDFEFHSNELGSRLSEDSNLSGAISPSLASAVAVSLLTDEDSDDKSSASKRVSSYIPPGVSPVPKRRPVKRRKSGLSHKKSITYVARPNIMRAPSTLKRTSKKTGKFNAFTYNKYH